MTDVLLAMVIVPTFVLSVFTIIHRMESEGWWWEPAERAKRERNRRMGKRIASLIREGMTPNGAREFAQTEAAEESARTRKAHQEAK